MTKPAITKRSVKGAALTYSELDTNFENLKDATITLTAGTGGTAVTADLNGNITLVAGTGVTLTGDNTTKTITVTASTGLQTPWTSNVDTDNYKLVNNSGNTITLAESKIIVGDGNTSILAEIRPESGNLGIIIFSNNDGSGPTISFDGVQGNDGDIVLGWGGSGLANGTIQFPSQMIGSTPSNTTTPFRWLKIKVAGMSGVVGYIPIYQ
jgi:hypothetical protein